MELDYTVLGKRIAKRRKALHMKQRELAERVNTSNNYLSGIEHGKEKPNLELLVSLCEAMDVRPDYLLVGASRSNNVPQTLMDRISLCSDQDIRLLENIVELFVARNQGDEVEVSSKKAPREN